MVPPEPSLCPFPCRLCSPMALMLGPPPAGFLELHMDRGIARGIALDEDSRTATAIVAHVLQGSPSELTAEMQRRVASFLPSVCARLYAERQVAPSEQFPGLLACSEVHRQGTSRWGPWCNVSACEPPAAPCGSCPGPHSAA